MHAIKRLKNRTITILLSAVIAISLIIGAVTIIGRPAAAESIDDRLDYAPTTLGLSNTHFDSSSGSYPASPTSWTGAALDGSKAQPIHGVVDLSASGYSGSNSGNKKFKLDQYKEYSDEKDMPKTIFGAGSKYAGSNEKALMINTPVGAEVAYAYSSADMTFSPNSFYRISVWVKTGDFNYAANQGATVKLTGLGQNCAFNNINTVMDLDKKDGIPVLDESNDYGWVKYRFYVRSSSTRTATVKLVLGLGDAVSNTDEDPDVMPAPAHGYAFFDTVTAERISAYDFASETAHFDVATSKPNMFKDSSGTAIALNLNEAKSFEVGGKEVGTFSQNTDLWRKNVYFDENSTDLSYSGMAHAYLYNSEARIHDMDSDSNTYGFSQNPWAPYGRAEYSTLDGHRFFDGTNNADIMLITTRNGKDFTEAAYGIASPTVKIERYGYYRFSVWIKDDKVEGGNGISILLKGKNANAQKVSTLTSYTGLTGDSSDTAHYGWKEHVVYLRGSMLFDYDVRFELWLGSPEAKSSGIAMFDNVTFTKLDYSDYSDMSSAEGSNIYEFDNLEDSTGIANGSFYSVGDMEEIKYPMPAAEWTYMTPDTVNTSGFSAKEVNTDNAVHGIIPTDSATFPTVSQAIPGIIRPSGNTFNVLLLSSKTPTAFCYQSQQITLSTDKANKLVVDLAVNNISGYGASLVLKTTDGNVVSTIEGITDTNGVYKPFTFYLDAPLADQTVNVEIWLGLNDRENNESKLSSGNVYVKQVSISEWTVPEGSETTVKQEYEAKLAEYKEAVKNRASVKALDYGVYSFASPTLDYYDAYTYAANDGYGKLYQWALSTADSSKVKSGMFNSDFMKNLTVYNGFDKKDLTGNMLYVYNTDYNRTAYTYNNSLALVASKYYRLDVTLKVRLTDEIKNNKDAVGAGISLTGTTAKFENIKDTTTLIDKNNEESRDYETFQTYTFYIATGDNGGNIGLDITFGGDDVENYIMGELVVGNIVMTEIDNLDFEEAEKVKNNSKQIAVRLSDTTDDKDNSDTEAPQSEVQWWIIPTVIFGAALIIAVAIIIVIRVRDRIKSKKKVVYSSEYDRSDVIKDIERLQAQKDGKDEEIKPVLSDDDDEYYVPQAKHDDNAGSETDSAEENTESAQPDPESDKADKTDSLDD